jgi:hypothetical protein
MFLDKQHKKIITIITITITRRINTFPFPPTLKGTRPILTTPPMIQKRTLRPERTPRARTVWMNQTMLAEPIPLLNNYTVLINALLLNHHPPTTILTNEARSIPPPPPITPTTAAILIPIPTLAPVMGTTMVLPMMLTASTLLCNMSSKSNRTSVN